ncbi:uncharacterized protein NEMAJ01_1041 [Nematocida major]|uniref:uncharacterized protein n=1 Tax=Nematocida major TaxID=1912982 RepID=UPI002007639C|nr:uncharacterized protein NEMAJ01_1041 [Nematocida major]KAH9386145.1 hypothetical protein NEMAJ01_1041 [Nematocida major]
MRECRGSRKSAREEAGKCPGQEKAQETAEGAGSAPGKDHGGRGPHLGEAGAALETAGDAERAESEEFGDFNALVEREEGNVSESAPEDAGSDLESGADELLRLEDFNRAQAEKAKKSVAAADLTSTYRVLTAMHKEGPEGAISADEFEFLQVLGEENAGRILQEQAQSLVREVEGLFKTPAYKKLNKQRLIRQRINYSLAEKAKTLPERYEDLPFVIAITKDFCYKTGAKIYKRTTDKKIPKIKRHTYQKMVGFCSVKGEYAFSPEKIEEFIKSILQ